MYGHIVWKLTILTFVSICQYQELSKTYLKYFNIKILILSIEKGVNDFLLFYFKNIIYY